MGDLFPVVFTYSKRKTLIFPAYQISLQKDLAGDKTREDISARFIKKKKNSSTFSFPCSFLSIGKVFLTLTLFILALRDCAINKRRKVGGKEQKVLKKYIPSFLPPGILRIMVFIILANPCGNNYLLSFDRFPESLFMFFAKE